jgi:hypothetical protein
MSRIVSIVSIAVVSAAIALLSLPTAPRATPLAQGVNSATQLAENNVACNRRGCHTMRAGCRIVRAPHPRDNRRVCDGPRRG